MAGTTMNRKPSDEQVFDELTEELIRDVIETSDEEILLENYDDNTKENLLLNRVNEVIHKAFISSGREKMQRAREHLSNTPSNRERVLNLDFSSKLRILNANIKALSDNDNNKLTIAARKGGEMDENELNSTLEALMILGIIDDNGKMDGS